MLRENKGDSEFVPLEGQHSGDKIHFKNWTELESSLTTYILFRVGEEVRAVACKIIETKATYYGIGMARSP